MLKQGFSWHALKWGATNKHCGIDWLHLGIGIPSRLLKGILCISWHKHTLTWRIHFSHVSILGKPFVDCSSIIYLFVVWSQPRLLLEPTIINYQKAPKLFLPVNKWWEPKKAFLDWVEREESTVASATNFYLQRVSLSNLSQLVDSILFSSSFFFWLKMNFWLYLHLLDVFSFL